MAETKDRGYRVRGEVVGLEMLRIVWLKIDRQGREIEQVREGQGREGEMSG